MRDANTLKNEVKNEFHHKIKQKEQEDLTGKKENRNRLISHKKTQMSFSNRQTPLESQPVHNKPSFKVAQQLEQKKESALEVNTTSPTKQKWSHYIKNVGHKIAQTSPIKNLKVMKIQNGYTLASNNQRHAIIKNNNGTTSFSPVLNIAGELPETSLKVFTSAIKEFAHEEEQPKPFVIKLNKRSSAFKEGTINEETLNQTAEQIISIVQEMTRDDIPVKLNTHAEEVLKVADRLEEFSKLSSHMEQHIKSKLD